MIDALEDLCDDEIDRLLAEKPRDEEMSEFFERLSKLSPKRLALLALELQ